MTRCVKFLASLALVGVIGMMGAAQAESLNSRLNGKMLSEFLMHKGRYGSETMGFALMFPQSWWGKFKVSEDAKFAKVNVTCENSLVFSVIKVPRKEFEKRSAKVDFMGEYLAGSEGTVWYADKSQGRPEMLSKKMLSPACQKLVDDTTVVTHSFMLVVGGKLVDPVSQRNY